MNNKIVIQFTVLTFLIAVVTWGICTVFGLFGFTIGNAGWLWVFIALCALSPTIASYIVLKRNTEVKGLKEWIKNVFNFKSSFRFYLLVVLLILAYYVPSIIITGLEESVPFYMFFAFLPLVLIGGGIEEAGWSYVLRPQLDKKFGFIISSLIVAVIWAVWHIPVFLPQGRIESLSWFALFTIGCIGKSFALGAIIRITKNVWLSVLFHTLSNAVAMTLYGYNENSDSLIQYTDSLTRSIVASSVCIIVSIMAVFFHEKRKKINNH